jgi:hypothetical protein
MNTKRNVVFQRDGRCRRFFFQLDRDVAVDLFFSVMDVAYGNVCLRQRPSRCFFERHFFLSVFEDSHGEFLCLLFLQAHRETEAHLTAAGMP